MAVPGWRKGGRSGRACAVERCERGRVARLDGAAGGERWAHTCGKRRRSTATRMARDALGPCVWEVESCAGGACQDRAREWREPCRGERWARGVGMWRVAQEVRARPVRVSGENRVEGERWARVWEVESRTGGACQARARERREPCRGERWARMHGRQGNVQVVSVASMCGRRGIAPGEGLCPDAQEVSARPLCVEVGSCAGGVGRGRAWAGKSGGVSGGVVLSGVATGGAASPSADAWDERDRDGGEGLQREGSCRPSPCA